LSLLLRDFVFLKARKFVLFCFKKGPSRPADEGLCGSAQKYIINILKNGGLWVVPT
jgi:hypothetical protein